MELVGRQVRVTTGGGWDGIFQTWIQSSPTAIVAIIERDTGYVEEIAPADFYFSPASVPELQNKIIGIKICHVSMASYIFALTQTGEIWYSAKSHMPNIPDVPWTQIPGP